MSSGMPRAGRLGVEQLERRELLSSDVQIVPLHGAFCHCAACSCAADAQNHALSVPLDIEPAALTAQASAIQKLTVFVPPENVDRVATVIPLETGSVVSPVPGVESPEPSSPVVTPSGAFAAKINFQPSNSSAFTGYQRDSGAKYAKRSSGLTYGWKSDNSSSHYDRNNKRSPDQRYDTIAKMSSSDVWEIAVPKGWYDVSLYVGDPNSNKGDHRINVEGDLAVWVKFPYTDRYFGEGHITQYVSDGKLTISVASGAKDVALGFVTISATSAPPTTAFKNDLKWSKGSINSPIGRVESGVVRVGDKMYFMGGYADPYYKSVSNRVDILDINTGKWSRGKNVPGAQTHAGATTDGRYIYWAGGQYGALFARKGTNEVWRYDTKTDKWDRYANLPVVRFGGGLAHLDGKLYFFGGAQSDRVTASGKAWVLDTTDSDPDWTSIASMPRAADHIGHAVVDGQIYAIGGEHDHGVSYVQHSDVFSYNPKSNKWSTRASMPTASSHFEGNVVEHDDKIWVFGGQVDAQLLTDEVRSYDPATNKWTLHPSMPEMRKGGAGWYNNGKFYYLTGDAFKKGQPKYVLQATLS